MYSRSLHLSDQTCSSRGCVQSWMLQAAKHFMTQLAQIMHVTVTLIAKKKKLYGSGIRSSAVRAWFDGRVRSLASG